MFSVLLPHYASVRPQPCTAFSVTSPGPSKLWRVGRVFNLGAIIALGAILAGCASTRIDPAIKSEQQAQQVALGQQLDSAIARVNKQPRWSTSLDDRASFASFNSNAVSVSYQGSAADLMKAVAASRGLSFKVTGPSPHIPIFVFVETEGQPFEDFLRDLDKQFGQRADVVWTDKSFELRYRQ